MNWFFFIILALFFILTPYERGFFFDKDFFGYEAVLDIVFLVFLVYAGYKKSLSKLSWNLLIFLLPFVFLLSFFVAESPYGALQHVLRWTSFAGFFLILWWVSRQERIQRWIPLVIVVTGTWIAVFAVLGLYGYVDFKDVLLNNRFTGVFQYPNTFASVIGAVWLLSLFQLTQKKLAWYEAILYSLPLVVFGVAFLHSYSRGAWLIFPLAWWLGLVFLQWNKQLKFIVYSLISGLASVYVFREVIGDVKQKLPSPGSTELILFTLVVMVLILVLHLLNRKWILQRVERFTSIRLTRLILPVVIAGFGVFLLLNLYNQGSVYEKLPETVQTRIDSIGFETTSVEGRTAFYEDALEMFKQSPILGLGGEGWRVLFTKYQDMPYWSNEIHNGYLEWLLSVGALGTLVIVFVFSTFAYQILRHWREQRRLEEQTVIAGGISALAMMLMHGAIDFDFSFGTVWLFILAFMAMVMPKEVKVSSEVSALSTHKKDTLRPDRKLWWKRISLSLVVIGVALSTVYSCRFAMAEGKMETLAGNKNANQVMQILEEAVGLNPYDTNIRINQINLFTSLYEQSKSETFIAPAKEAMERAEALEPHNPNVLFAIALGYKRLGKGEKAVEYMDRVLKNDHFNTKFYETSLDLKKWVAFDLLREGKPSEAQEYAKSAVNDYLLMGMWNERYRSIEERLPNQRGYSITLEAKFLAAQSYYLLNKNQQVVSVLEPIKDKKKFKSYEMVNAFLAASWIKMDKPKAAQKRIDILQKQNPDFSKIVDQIVRLGGAS